MAELEHSIFVHPRLGSDYAFCISRRCEDGIVAVFGVLDTIGIQKGRQTRRFFKALKARFGKLVKDAGIGDIQALAGRVGEEVAGLNSGIRAMGKDIPDRMFGFCFAFGMICGNRLRTCWLGDCRTYVARPASGDDFPQVRCLTNDHNKLHDVLAENEEYVFLKNELSDLSRKLVYYWGMADEERLKEIIGAQERVVDLRSGDLILVATDGIYLPLVRSVMDRLNYRMTLPDYYLEDWFKEFLYRGKYLEGKSRGGSLLTDIHTFCSNYTFRKERYQDDIAAVTIRIG